jgi:hypothetical protein
MAAETVRTWGIARRMSYPGEAWHIVDVPDDFDWYRGRASGAARCGATPWLGDWGTPAGSTGQERLCKRCVRKGGGDGCDG